MWGEASFLQSMCGLFVTLRRRLGCLHGDILLKNLINI